MTSKINKYILSVTFIIFCIIASCIFIKAIKIQVIDRPALLSYYRSQVIREVQTYPYRGQILDRNGNALAINIERYSIFALPKEMDKKQSIHKLSSILPELKYHRILKTLFRRNKYTWLARKVQLSEKQKEELKKIKGIYLEPVFTRIYPNNELAGQLIGFVGIDNRGLAGLEYQHDEKLRGNPTAIRYVRDAKGRLLKHEMSGAQISGEDLNLSIDKDVQAYAERLIEEAVAYHEAIGAGVGVMNANTGEILAMANYPKYNPNKFKQYASNDRKISYISDPFEPGSVFKTFTLAAAIESKIADKDTSYYCEEGKFNVGGHVISEAESSKRFEWLTMEEILQHSSNIGTTKIAFDLTFPRLKKFIDSFNLNKKTNIELPAESRGIYIESENVTPLRLSNISFGQGIATTPLQILAGYSVFANGGEYVRPTILKVDGPVNKTRVISKDTADKVTKMLISSVYNGTGDSAKVPHFTIAGKTSTAQKQGASGKYETHIGGFAGFPVGLDNPFVIFVYIDSPKKNGYYGNQTASPVFSKLAEFMLYREKSHSIHAKVDTKTIKQVFDQIKVQDSARAVNSINASEMPNLLGLDKKSVNKLFHEHTYKILHKGHGIVIHQSIHAGTKIGPGTEFTIEYSPPRYE